MLLNTVSGILSLSALDLHFVTAKLKLAKGGLLDNLGGISIIGGFAVVFLIIIVLVAKFQRHPKVH